jgi:hypothetical protein
VEARQPPEGTVNYHRLVINNNPYVLRDRSVRESVAAAMVAAVRAGGDFVHVAGHSREFDVLVTPATDARLELVESEPTREAPTPTVDLDLDWAVDA